MTVRDVAGFLAVDEKTIYRLAQQGKLPGFKVAGTWRFQLQDIQGWIDQQKKQAAKNDRDGVKCSHPIKIRTNAAKKV